MKTQWLWGDGHCHSYFSDGLHSISELSTLYEEYDMDFRFQTDHVFVKMPDGHYMNPYEKRNGGRYLSPDTLNAYLEECKNACTDKHIVIPGLELGLQFRPDLFPWSINRFFDHHILLRHITQNILPDESLMKNKWWKDIWELLSQNGNKLTIAHVTDDQTPWQVLPALYNLSSMEIIKNMEQNEPIEKRGWFSWWDYMLSAGHRIILTAGSDAHQADLWCAGSMRNVVHVKGESVTPASITEAVLAGRSYLSGTFHPPIWAEYGETGIPGSKCGFTPWFTLKENISRQDACDKVKKWIEKGLRNNYGRVKKENFPIMDFSVNGHSPGETVGKENKDKLYVKISLKMHLPVSKVELFSGGRPVWQHSPEKYEFLHEFELPYKPNLYYIRCLAYATGKHPTEQEVLISNPVWIA